MLAAYEHRSSSVSPHLNIALIWAIIWVHLFVCFGIYLWSGMLILEPDEFSCCFALVVFLVLCFFVYLPVCIVLIQITSDGNQLCHAQSQDMKKDVLSSVCFFCHLFVCLFVKCWSRSHWMGICRAMLRARTSSRMSPRCRFVSATSTLSGFYFRYL